MAYNELTAARIRNALQKQSAAFTEKKMFSGICFMVDDKMCLGTHFDKKLDSEVLLCRMSEADCQIALMNPQVVPMEFTGRAMKGYVFVKAPAYAQDTELDHWVGRCLAFNPMASRSKKK